MGERFVVGGLVLKVLRTRKNNTSVNGPCIFGTPGPDVDGLRQTPKPSIDSESTGTE